MDKRVESLQADCLDGGSTPPSSTRKERTSVLSFSCGADAPNISHRKVREIREFSEFRESEDIRGFGVTISGREDVEALRRREKQIIRPATQACLKGSALLVALLSLDSHIRYPRKGYTKSFWFRFLQKGGNGHSECWDSEAERCTELQLSVTLKVFRAPFYKKVQKTNRCLRAHRCGYRGRFSRRAR